MISWCWAVDIHWVDHKPIDKIHLAAYLHRRFLSRGQHKSSSATIKTRVNYENVSQQKLIVKHINGFKGGTGTVFSLYDSDSMNKNCKGKQRKMYHNRLAMVILTIYQAVIVPISSTKIIQKIIAQHIFLSCATVKISQLIKQPLIDFHEIYFHVIYSR